MIGHLESSWGKALEPAGHTFLEIKNLSAVPTVEMMMMTFVSAFIPRRLSRYLDTTDPPFIEEILQGAVDSSDPQGGNGLESKTVDVVWE